VPGIITIELIIRNVYSEPRGPARVREEDALAALEALGLTGKESRAYVAIVRNGASTARDVSAGLSLAYPAVYRILHSLLAKGWIEVGRERPSRYRARNPKIVAEETRRARVAALAEATASASALVDQLNTKTAPPGSDVILYKGMDRVAKKLRDIVLSGSEPLLVVSPFAVDVEVLRLLFGAFRAAPRPARVVMNERNAADVASLRGVLRPGVRVHLKFPPLPQPSTRLAHTFVFPSDHELFILNSFYRDGEFVVEKVQGLWIGDADYVRLQLEAMVKGLEPIQRMRKRRALPSG